MSQRVAGADAGHPDGLHLHTDVLHLPEQRGENEQILTKFDVDSSYLNLLVHNDQYLLKISVKCYKACSVLGTDTVYRVFHDYRA